MGPPKLSAERVQQRIDDDINEYFSLGDIRELCACVLDLSKRTAKLDDSVPKMLCKQAIIKTFDARGDGPKQKVATMFAGLHKEKLLVGLELVAVFKELLEGIEDEAVDVPHISSYMSLYIGHAIADEVIPMSFLCDAFNHLIESYSVPALTMATNVLKTVLELKGEDKARDMYEKSNLKLETLVEPGKPRDAEAIAALLDDEGLGALDPSLLRSVKEAKEKAAIQAEEERRLSLLAEVKGYLSKALGKERPEAILSWMREHCPSESAGPQVTRAVLRCLLDGASDGAPNADAILGAIEKHKMLLQLYTEGTRKGDFSRQTQCLYEVQAYCFEHNFPAGLMKAVFRQLYDKDIVFQDAVAEWREDLTETPGKTKALVQVREFIEWLEEAEEESDEATEDD